MHSLNRGAVVRSLLSMAVLVFAVFAVPALAQKADRPNVKVGDQWRFEVRLGPSAVKTQDIDWVITSVTSAGIEGTENGKPLVLTSDLNVVESPRSKNSNSRLLTFPLEVAKHWQFTDDILVKNADIQQRAVFAVTVVSYEKVRVLAGEFDAFKLEAKSSWVSGGATGETTRTYWYAPAARAVVRMESRDTAGGLMASDLAEFHLQP